MIERTFIVVFRTARSIQQLRSLCIQIVEADLIEKFIRGSGPGGQSINKTRNNVQLTHVPTGIRVECQETRDLHSNRTIARKILKNKLELLEKGEDSKIGKRIKKLQKRKYNAARRAKKKYAEEKPAELKQPTSTGASRGLAEADEEDDLEFDEEEDEEVEEELEVPKGDSKGGLE